jgi:hypothetical protein
VLEADAKQLGAAYVLKTETRNELREVVASLVGARRREAPDGGVRRWPRKVVATPTVATVAASPARVVDVSYGGVCLKLPTPPGPRAEQKPPEEFDIVFPALQLALKVSRVWVAPDATQDGWLCGVDLSQNRGDALDRWRSYVDSVN